MKRLLFVCSTIMLVFCQIARMDFSYAADWKGAVTVNNRNTWTENTERNNFASILSVGVDDQLFKKNRLGLNLFLPYRVSDPGRTSYSPSVSASLTGKSYSLFANYGEISSSDELLGDEVNRRQQINLNTFPRKLPSFSIRYNKSERIRDHSGDKGTSSTDWSANSSYTIKKITLSGNIAEQKNNDAGGLLTRKVNLGNWGASTTFDLLPRTSATASYYTSFSDNEDLLDNEKTTSINNKTSASITSSPFVWGRVYGRYSISDSEFDFESDDETRTTTSSKESNEIALTITPYPKLSLNTSVGSTKEEVGGNIRTTDSTSYSAGYNTVIARNINSALSVRHSIDDDSEFGKRNRQTYGFSTNMMVHSLTEATLTASLSRNEQPSAIDTSEEVSSETNASGTTKLVTFSNSWSIAVKSYPTDKLDLNFSYQVGGTDESFSIFKSDTQSMTIDLHYIPNRNTRLSFASVSSFGGTEDRTTLTGSLSYSSRLLRTITVSYSSDIKDLEPRDSLDSSLTFKPRRSTTVQIKYLISPLFTGTEDSGRTQSFVILLSKRL